MTNQMDSREDPRVIYADIIGLPHWDSPTHPRMSLLERAAQFSPFAALSGYDDAVKETARLTDEKTVLSEEELAQLNQKFALLMPHIKERPEVTLTRFAADEKKTGGRYLTETVRQAEQFKEKEGNTK